MTRGNVLIDTRHVEMDKLEGLQIPHREHIPVVIISRKNWKPQPGFITPEALITAGLKPKNVLDGLVELMARMLRAPCNM
jgi:hypothetical protein